ncbi:MAG: hypothetical protein B6241_01595 [Spirochaetaceae bacterium 4572_59]|nr:MAG: hypothetical protein B6241_01595 [Spirochaetaceae bacterium 4572_59]
MILTVDIGTSSMKGGLISDEGYLFSYHRVKFPHTALGGNGQFSVQLWIDGFSEIVEAVGAEKVSAVAISGNGPTMVPVGKNGMPLGSVLLWHFNQSEGIGKTSSYYLPKIKWLQVHDPDRYEKAELFLSCPELLMYLLTGEAVMVSPHKEFLPFIWDDESLDVLGLKRSAFPQIVDMGSIAGQVRVNPLLRTSLKSGTPVVACGSDFMASLIGTGTVYPGRICDRAGTSEGINYCSPKPLGNPHLRELPHAVEGMVNISAILSSTGSLFEWYRHLTGQEGLRYDETMEGVRNTSPEQEHPVFFPNLKQGLLWEFSNGMFTGLDPGQGKFELGRAVMEAIAFAVRRSLEIFESFGLPVEELRISGGQGKSRVWNQMKADITGKRILIPEIEDAELLGDACLAAVALGRYPDILKSSDELVKIKHQINPDSDLQKLYDSKYLRYRERCDGVKAFYMDSPGHKKGLWS